MRDSRDYEDRMDKMGAIVLRMHDIAMTDVNRSLAEFGKGIHMKRDPDGVWYKAEA
jgi:hypothetical protein